MKEISDQDIVTWLLTHGKQEHGFRCLMSKYKERMYWHIRKIVVCHEDADDVLQNTFIKVFRSIERFKGDSGLYTWMYRIATNESLTHLKKMKRISAKALDNEELMLSQKLVADTHFEGSVIQETLQNALLTLPTKQRMVFNMKYFDGMKYKEMSEVLETSVGALKASYHHARQKIEAYIKKQEII